MRTTCEALNQVIDCIKTNRLIVNLHKNVKNNKGIIEVLICIVRNMLQEVGFTMGVLKFTYSR
ncbi:protein of unknown function [Vibrio tapetis subsp. tapetis]|uniref:Uncharacterized protein n=1 Tax=Vibrio tapetis subsp. tapetis TaxID=1671868 RepID=A0A2N8ZJ77_9VIBR|nr:protein of unknown function [Vibrio tapetis subsp. tapetis]